MADPAAPASTCPICGRDTVQQLRPFCSKRCADVDLGRWFSGQYRTPSLRTESDEDDDGRLGPDSHPLDHPGDVG